VQAIAGDMILEGDRDQCKSAQEIKIIAGWRLVEGNAGDKIIASDRDEYRQ
jgi:hypothetical protein